VIVVYILHIRGIQRYLYQYFHKKNSVGVEIFNSKKKLVAIVFIIVLVLNLVLSIIGVISQFWFWIIVIVIGFVAYKVMPRLK